MGLINNILQVGNEVRTIFGKHYPQFVYGGPFQQDQVPVFVFHDIEPHSFEQQLIYLKENHYRTINTEEYYARLQGKAKLPQNAVILAIDDGEASIWQYAYPLLKKYECSAVVFLISGYLRHSSEYFYNLQDVWDNKCSLEQLTQRGDGYYGLLYWEEIKTMEASGVVDFQSHSHFHHQVFSGNCVTKFFDKPAIRFFDWVIPKDYEAYVMEDQIDEQLGFPVYEHDSIFRSMRRYLDNVDLRHKMQERTRQLGGLDFLQTDATAQKTLQGEFERLRKSYSTDSFQSEADTQREILDNLVLSRETIGEHLGKQVRHLCYPYSFYSTQAIELSKQAGFVSNFVGTHPTIRCNTPGSNPYYTVRLKSDFLPTLPGRGRVALGRVLLNKFSHRLKGKKI